MRQSYFSYEFDVPSPFQFIKTGKCEAVSSIQPHGPQKNNEFELIIGSEGTLSLQFGKNTCTVSPGKFLIFPPSLSDPKPSPPVRPKGAKETYCSYYWMCFSCSAASFFTGPYDSSRKTKPGAIFLPPHGSLLHPHKALLLMRQLQDCVRSGYDAHYLNYMATLILCEISNQNRFQLSREENGIVNGREQLYNDIIDYVNSFINEDLKVTNIARHFGYNDKYLSRYFKKISGVSLKHYILSQKIERANFLLTDTNLTVGDISDSLGFSDYHNFIRAYKSITSMTPSEYRNIYARRIVEHD